MSASYAWIITKDHLAEANIPEGTNSNAKGVIGPRNVTPEQVDRLHEGRIGEAFRIYDDDGELYYSGRIIGDYEGFEPLDDFGATNAGATDIKYRNHTSGKWELL